jgi:rod shape-determining protein MreD
MNYWDGRQQSYSRWIILLSFFLAFVLTILPLPSWANWLRPNWVSLVLVSWILILPERVGLNTAWFSGLILDVLENVTLGEHALILTIIAYSVQKFHTRINFFPFWQKSLIFFGLFLLAQILQFWMEGFMGREINNILYWSPVLTTTIFWPWVTTLLAYWQPKKPYEL